MKRRILVLVLALLLLTGCKKAPEGNFSPADQAILEQVVGQEALDKMDAAAQEQLLEDLRRYTPEDVTGQGRYVVILTDTPGLNTFTLHYEDGELIRAATSFRKSPKDTPQETYFTGSTLEDYHYKSIHFLSYGPQDLAALLSEEGFAQITVAPVE